MKTVQIIRSTNTLLIETVKDQRRLVIDQCSIRAIRVMEAIVGISVWSAAAIRWNLAACARLFLGTGMLHTVKRKYLTVKTVLSGGNTSQKGGQLFFCFVWFVVFFRIGKAEEKKQEIKNVVELCLVLVDSIEPINWKFFRICQTCCIVVQHQTVRPRADETVLLMSNNNSTQHRRTYLLKARSLWERKKTTCI